MRKPFSKLIRFSFVFFRNFAPIVSHMAPKEFHGRLNPIFQEQPRGAHYERLLKEKMSLSDRSFERTSSKKPKDERVCPVLSEEFKKNFIRSLLGHVGGGRRGLSTLAHRRNTVDDKWWPSPLFRLALRAQWVGATLVRSLLAGVSNPEVFRGR
jgi:hypothetical protein